MTRVPHVERESIIERACRCRTEIVDGWSEQHERPETWTETDTTDCHIHHGEEPRSC